MEAWSAKQWSRPDEGGEGVVVGRCGCECVTVVRREMRCVALLAGVGHGALWAWRKWDEQRWDKQTYLMQNKKVGLSSRWTRAY